MTPSPRANRNQESLKLKLQQLPSDQEVKDLNIAKDHFTSENDAYEKKTEVIATEAQFKLYELKYKELLSSFDISNPDDILADCQDFGTATLLSVRDTFKSKVYAIVYSLFVIAAVFHGCNGFWTFLITWGLIFKQAAQKSMVGFSIFLMLLLGFLGLAAIWGSYFINLKT